MTVDLEPIDLRVGIVCPRCGRHVGSVSDAEPDMHAAAAAVLAAHECAS